MLLFFVLLYLAATVWIGVRASRRVRTSGDYMLAGRSLPLTLSSAALFATWFGSETVFGASAEFLEGGFLAVIEDPFGAALCLVLFGLFYTRKLYNMNLLTLGDFFRVRFGRRTELLATIFLAPPYVGYIAAQLVAMALILQVIVGITLWQGVVVSAVIVTIYTYSGGMWAISITDFVQSIIIILGLVIVAVVLTVKAGGVAPVFASAPAGTFRLLPAADSYSVAGYLAAWSVLGLGSIPSQDVFQRAMSARSASTAVRACYIGAAAYLVFAMLPLFICLCIKYLYGNAPGADPQSVLPDVVLRHTTVPVQIIFFGSLLSAIMSTTSSAILAPAAIFSENLVKPLLRGRISDGQLLIYTKAGVVLFAGAACVMATMRSNIYELVGESSILSLVSLFVPMTLGLYWNRTNAAGAIAGMFAGMTAWVILQFVETPWPVLIPATLASLVFTLGVSLLPNTRYVQKLS